jgi:hypothetical protein
LIDWSLMLVLHEREEIFGSGVGLFRPIAKLRQPYSVNRVN